MALHKNSECIQCLEVKPLVIDVGFIVCYGGDTVYDLPMCLSCRLDIDVHRDKEHATPFYYWRHMRTVAQQAKGCQPVE